MALADFQAISVSTMADFIYQHSVTERGAGTKMSLHTTLHTRQTQSNLTA